MIKNYETTESEVNQISVAKENENISELKVLYEEYQSNPKQFIKGYNKELKDAQFPKIDRVEFQFNNDNYETLSDHLVSLLQNEIILEAKKEIIYSMIQIKNLWILKIHNSTTISCINGSHLRFCPYKDGIEISRIYVPEQYHGKGFGTGLIMLLFVAIKKCLSIFPDIVLECTGAVGYRETLQLNHISNQIRFFRKFGFYVCQDDSNYPFYVKMKFDLTKMNMISIAGE